MTEVCPALILEEEQKWEAAFAGVGESGDNPGMNSMRNCVSPREERAVTCEEETGKV